jgi:hypothetical protein
MSVSGFRWWDHKPLLRIPGLVVGSWGSWFLLLVSFWSTADWSDWISGGKTFDILCLFCQTCELICAWKWWLYVSLWKLLFVFLYHWHLGGLWTTFLQIIMSKFNVMNFHHLLYINTYEQHDPRMKRILFLNDRRLTVQSLEVSKIKCFSYLFFY